MFNEKISELAPGGPAQSTDLLPIAQANPDPTSWTSRKFWMAVFAQVSSVALCYAGKISGDAWVTVTTIVLGVHNASNVIDKKINGD